MLAAAVVLVAVGGLGLAPVGASGPPVAHMARRHIYEITGSFVDPGPVLGAVTPDGSRFRVDLTGGTQWSGQLSGTSTYTGTVWSDGIPPAAVNGIVHETFTGSLAGVGSGQIYCLDELEPRGRRNGSGGLRGERRHRTRSSMPRARCASRRPPRRMDPSPGRLTGSCS